MKAKNIFFVAVIFLGLLAYIVSFEIPRSERREAERKPFYDISKGQLVSIDVKHNSEEFKLENSQPKKAISKSKLDESQLRIVDSVSPNDWKISGFVFNQVDSTSLNDVINQLMAYELGEPLPSTEVEGDLSLYGIAKPEVVLVAERLDQYANLKTLKFEFGKKSDFLAKRYVRYTRADGSSDIFLTDDLLYFAINKPSKDFRRKDPVAFTDSAIKKIEMTVRGNDKLVIEKQASKVPGMTGERWSLLAPLAVSADQSKVAEFVRNLKSLKVKSYLEGDEATSKSALFLSPSMQASLSFGSSAAASAPIGIKLATEKEGESEKSYFLIDGISTVFEAETNTLANDLAGVDFYRQTKFFDFEIDQVQSFELAGSHVLGLKGEKKNDAWVVADKPGDDVFMRQWLSDLKDLKAQSFPTESKDFGFATPAYKLSIRLADDYAGNENKTFNRVLVVGNPQSIEDSKPKAYYASVDDFSEPFVISVDDVTKITPKLDSLLKLPTATPTAIASAVATLVPDTAPSASRDLAATPAAAQALNKGE